MSATLELRLPDGSTRQVQPGTTVAEVAADIGPGLLKAAVAGVVDGDVVELAQGEEVSFVAAEQQAAVAAEQRCFHALPQASGTSRYPLPQTVLMRVGVVALSPSLRRSRDTWTSSVRSVPSRSGSSTLSTRGM